jgi:hypothetical protein
MSSHSWDPLWKVKRREKGKKSKNRKEDIEKEGSTEEE